MCVMTLCQAGVNDGPSLVTGRNLTDILAAAFSAPSLDEDPVTEGAENAAAMSLFE